VTQIRGGKYEGDTQYAPLEAEPARRECFFCAAEVWLGAFWAGATGEIAVCSRCVRDGRLGMLIGDAVGDVFGIGQAVLATELHAYRSRLLAIERQRSAFPDGF
jgi:hypothetical protein